MYRYEDVFKSLKADNLWCHELLYNIPRMCSLPVCVKKVINKVPDFSYLRWNYTIYVCDETNLEMIVFDTSETNIIDGYGNLHKSETEFLKSLRFKKYRTSRNYSSFHYSIPNNENNDFLTNLKAGLERLLPVKGVDLLHKFNELFQEDAETKLKEIKVVYAFFVVLSKPQNVEFSLNGGFKVHVLHDSHVSVHEVDLNELKREIYFDNFDKSINKTQVSPAFTRWCQSVLDKLHNESMVKWTTNQLTRYIYDINNRFVNSHFTINCHKMAADILSMRNNDNANNAIPLAKFKYIVYWEKFAEKCFPEVLPHIPAKMQQYFNQYVILLEEVKKCQMSTHKFANDHSSMYHTNRHFNELKKCHLNIKFCPKPGLLSNLAQKASEVATLSLKPTDDITQIQKSILRQGIIFYLKDIPDFLFNPNFYFQNDYVNGYYKERNDKDTLLCTNYIAGATIFGVKVKPGDHEFVATIHRK